MNTSPKTKEDNYHCVRASVELSDFYRSDCVRLCFRGSTNSAEETSADQQAPVRSVLRFSEADGTPDHIENVTVLLDHLKPERPIFYSIRVPVLSSRPIGVMSKVAISFTVKNVDSVTKNSTKEKQTN
jgi:hypothetical protein